ncbi:PfkB family carbohydrate kinase [Georgenia satyanarayanai]|uniref:1-phosphofructokinase family hexose kinase n=1 Tax=Georgenia satyanarayanai TaxID=860221 RepID=UPI00203C5943|nr:PfkB family carbohydrate kinase [Georgenia satyanarayanai]MCM3660315.1 PfkB family carbohydrate kinase [Georgenia satyanarayanai]
MEQQSAHRPRLCVLAPTPLLMVEVEPGEDGDYEHSADLHLHPGGQGLWVARMAISLGAEVTVCGPFGGEVGAVLAHMLSEEKLTVRAVPYNAGNGAYVHDRRGGDRATLAHMVPPQLTRHELDDLYGTVLVEALESDVLVLTGAEPDRVLPAGFFSRLVRDVHSVEKPIVADLSGDAAKAAAAEGPTVLKMSHEELQGAGLTTGDSVEELQAAGRRLVEQGVGAMLISRAGEPTLLVTAESTRLLVGPVVTPLDHRGAGDSMTAGVAVALGRGASVGEAARLGAAAGALNVTRRGLGTGRREQIERFADRIGIEVVPRDDGGRAEV